MYVKENLHDVVDEEKYSGHQFCVEIKILILDNYINCFGDYKHNYTENDVVKILNTFVDYYKEHNN